MKVVSVAFDSGLGSEFSPRTRTNSGTVRFGPRVWSIWVGV
ncbi:hypothetical protein OROHE_016052 [Orobanche hederae]